MNSSMYVALSPVWIYLWDGFLEGGFLHPRVCALAVLRDAVKLSSAEVVLSYPPTNKMYREASFSTHLPLTQFVSDIFIPDKPIGENGI